YSTLRRLAVGDTAGWQPALRVRFMESPLSAFPACIGTMNLPGNSKAPQERRTPKPGGGSGGLGQRASVLECGGPPPLSKGARTRNSYGSWKAPSGLASVRCWDHEPVRTIQSAPGQAHSKTLRKCA